MADNKKHHHHHHHHDHDHDHDHEHEHEHEEEHDHDHDHDHEHEEEHEHAETSAAPTAAASTGAFEVPNITNDAQCQAICDALIARGDPVLQSTDGWAPVDHGEKSLPTLKLWCKLLPGSPFMAVKTQYTYDVPLEKMFRFFWDSDFSIRKQLSPELTHYSVVKEITPTQKLIQMRMSLPFPMSSRESLLLTTYRREGDNKMYYYGVSCEHADVPADPGYLRAITLLLVSSLEQVEANKTQVVTIGHADPKGWIPAWLINFMIKKQASQVKKLKEVLNNWNP